MLFHVLTETLSLPVPLPAETASRLAVWALEKSCGSEGNVLLHCEGLHCEGLHCDGLHCDGLHCDGLHCDGLHCDGLHCDGLHCDALHCDGLHCDGLHCDGEKAEVLSEGSQFVGSQAEGLYCEVLNTSVGVSAPCLARSSSARPGPVAGFAPAWSAS